MAGANISYKRAVFEAHGAFIEGTYCSDTEFHWRLGREGLRIRFDPSIVVFHRNLEGLDRFLAHEFFHGRSFAAVRCRAKAFSPARRALHALLSPLVFLKLLARNAALGILFGAYPASYLKALPVTALGILFWTVGEAAGYTRGPRRGKGR
jgi:GT2 family glycosyltransferase